MRIRSDVGLLGEALGYIYYYNNLREHSSLGFKSPFSYLKTQLPETDDKIRIVISIALDKVAVEMGPWSGYHVLAEHPIYFREVLRQSRGYLRADNVLMPLNEASLCYVVFSCYCSQYSVD